MTESDDKKQRGRGLLNVTDENTVEMIRPMVTVSELVTEERSLRSRRSESTTSSCDNRSSEDQPQGER
jgi:hypothetical protein